MRLFGTEKFCTLLHRSNLREEYEGGQLIFENPLDFHGRRGSGGTRFRSELTNDFSPSRPCKETAEEDQILSEMQLREEESERRPAAHLQSLNRSIVAVASIFP